MNTIQNYGVMNNKVSFHARGNVPKGFGEWSLLEKRMSSQQKRYLICDDYIHHEQGLAKTLIDLAILKIVDFSRSTKSALSMKISNIGKYLNKNVKR